jgi:hypothetical protein
MIEFGDRPSHVIADNWGGHPTYAPTEIPTSRIPPAGDAGSIGDILSGGGGAGQKRTAGSWGDDLVAFLEGFAESLPEDDPRRFVPARSAPQPQVDDTGARGLAQMILANAQRNAPRLG